MAFMHHPMMPVAKKSEIVEIGRPAMDPTNQVMSIAP
jgi:hypothetical protein